MVRDAERYSVAFVYRLLETISFALFHPASTLSGSLRSPPSPRGEGFVSRIAVFSYRSLPHRGRGTASAVDRVLPLIVDLRRFLFHLYRLLETIFPALFHAAFPIQPPPLRGTSFHRKEGVSTRAPSLGRGCRAQRGGVGFIYLRRSRLLFAFPIGEGGPRQRWIGYCRKSST